MSSYGRTLSNVDEPVRNATAGPRPCPFRQRCVPNARFSFDGPTQAIARACKAAGVPQWSPNRLRHTAVTLIREEFGLDVAQVILGHKSVRVTQVYAEVNRRKAIEVVKRIG